MLIRDWEKMAVLRRINKIQKALGFPKSELPELDPEWIDGELSKRYSVKRRKTR